MEAKRRLRQLTIAAVSGALLGAAASGLVRLRLSRVEQTAMTLDASENGSVEVASGEITAPRAADHADGAATAEAIALTAPSRTSGVTRRTRRGSHRLQAPEPPSDPLSRGIRKLGDRRYEIDQATLRLALANPASLSRWARVVPELRANKPVGFRLSWVAAQGPFAKLGLQHDDVLVSVNGLDIATPDRALEAYSKLSKASRLVLGLERGGMPVKQTYIVR